MSATLDTPPPARAYSANPIWLEVATDLITGAAGYFEITIANGGPSDTQTLTLTWPGGSITYTAATSPDSSGLQWPLQGADTLTAYTTAIAEVLRQREDVGEVFDISIINAPGGILRLTAKVVEAFALSFTDSMTNVAVTKADGTAATAEDNLRAYIEVWADTGNFNTDTRLIALHSPYDTTQATTPLDIGAAFAHLAPHLPDESTINPTSPSALTFGAATGHYQPYYLRLADKYGTPAVAEALLRSDDSYLAVLGARATDAEINTLTGLRHAYRRRDEGPGRNFRKPVGQYQPDWVYYLFDTGVDVYVTLTIYWSDGTTSAYDPFDTDTVSIPAGNTIYWFPSGFRQMKLHNLAPSGATDPDAYIVKYDWKLKPEGTALVTVRYEVMWDSSWEYYLAFANGVGGIESVWLRGKTNEAYTTTAEEIGIPRRPDHSPQRGDFDTYSPAGRPQWECSTGWYDDAFYLEHLRQLPLSKAWLIDRINRRFLRVVVQPGTLENIREDDQTLYSLKFNIKAAWQDAAANL